MTFASGLIAPHEADLNEIDNFASHCSSAASRASESAASVRRAAATVQGDNRALTSDALAAQGGHTQHELDRAADAVRAWSEAARTYERHLAEIAIHAHPIMHDGEQALRQMRAIDPTGHAVAFLPLEARELYTRHEEVFHSVVRHLRGLVEQRNAADAAFAEALGRGHDSLGSIPASVLTSLGSPGRALDADSVSRFLLSAIWDDVENASGYGLVDLPLFLYDEHGNLIIDSSQVSQGGLGDCWFVATMMAVADSRPDLIRSMIKYDPETGLYTVTLHDDKGKPIEIEVDGRLLLDGDDRTFGAGRPEDKVLWPAIIEKALAQQWGGYKEIEGDDPTKAIRLLTGATDIHEDSFGNWVQEMFDHDDVTAKKLAAALDNGGIAIAYTRTSLDADSLVHKNHAYYVTKVTGNLVTLQNPWGTDAYPPVTLTWDEFTRDFQGTRWTDA